MAYTRLATTTTKTGIINLALSKLGSDRVQLADYAADNTEIRELIDFYFESTLLETVSYQDWNCCTFREKIVANSIQGDGIQAADAYPYNRKSVIAGSSKQTTFDAIRVLSVQSLLFNGLGKIDTQTAPSKVMWEQRRNELLMTLNASHQNSVAIAYTTLPVTTATTGEYELLDSFFLKCWYTNLAYKLCVPLTGQKDLEEAIETELNTICIPEAKLANSTEGSQMVPIGADLNEIQSINTYKNFGKV